MIVVLLRDPVKPEIAVFYEVKLHSRNPPNQMQYLEASFSALFHRMTMEVLEIM